MDRFLKDNFEAVVRTNVSSDALCHVAGTEHWTASNFTKGSGPLVAMLDLFCGRNFQIYCTEKVAKNGHRTLGIAHRAKGLTLYNFGSSYLLV